MIEIRCESNLEECRRLWQTLIPSEKITDLWETRECFQSSFNRDLLFIVAEDAGQVVGLLPLAWVAEKNYYGYFPGEVWKGTTWLEQNRIIARDKDVMKAMFGWLVDNKKTYHLRYMNDHSAYDVPAEVDEIGYLFQAPKYDYRFESYHEEFSRKSIKAILKGIQAFRDRGMEIRLDHLEDFDLLVEMNLSRFGESSYFADDRFTKGFRNLRDLLHQNGWLKMVTILVEGRPAAVDMGSVYKGAYTLIGGGTHADFVGIAKVINMFHIQRSCEEKYLEADFLCGDFLWKPMFHLTPRPLYLMANIHLEKH